ncbi:MAG: hypothetical protein ABIH99_01820 [Candidatus Micrarchaeota archaeon]
MALVFDIETGRIDLTAIGENAVIIRKDGKKVSIPSVEVENKLIEEFQKTKDCKKLDKYKEDYPHLIDGDTIICGKETKVRLYNNYNNGKEKPIDDYKASASKSIDLLPGSELQVSGIEQWDKTDPKTKERHHGELIKNITLKKGFFQVSYSHTDDILATPVASIKFIFDGGGFFDVYDDIVYSAPRSSTSIGAGGTEYTNKLTKKSFIAKSSMFEEIIVTRDGIYRRGLTQMDDIFLNSVQLTMFFQNITRKMMPSASMDPKALAEQYKDMPKTMEQTLGGLEMMKSMSPDDLARLMSMGGQKPTPEMMEKIKELPEMLKMMEQKGAMKQMKQAMAMGKGMMEGLGNEGIERMVRAQSKGFEQVKKQTEQSLKVTTADGKSIDLDSFFNSPRKYKPLSKEPGAVKVA